MIAEHARLAGELKVRIGNAADAVSSRIRAAEALLASSAFFVDENHGDLLWDGRRIVHINDDKPLIECKLAVRMQADASLDAFTEAVLKKAKSTLDTWEKSK